jgi:TonB-dependent SusC/RagA subfamily outer membrane receptor
MSAIGHAARLARAVARSSALAFGLTLVAAGARVGEAQTGTVVGTVTDRGSGQPLEAARAQIVGSTAGAASDARGRFVLRNVAAGSYSVRVSRIGYRPEIAAVSVTGGDSARVTITLLPSAVELEQVVVTGTGGAVEKKQLGVPIGIVDADKVQSMTPVPDVGSVLMSKVPGLRSIDNGGGAGAAKDLRIRGIGSFSLSQRPAIYIDGVKVDTKAVDWTANMPNQGCCNFNGGVGEDRLSDLNPDDIEHIEVLKGPAAATLYGSDATNGVIQIFTKKGRLDNAPQWNVSLTGGFDEQPHNYPTKLYPNFVGPDGTRALDMNKTLIGKGPYQDYQVSVQGGANRASYFVSGGYSDEQGSIQPNDERKGTLRVNVSWQPTDKLTFDTRAFYGRNYINSLQGGNNWTALTGNASNGDPRNATQLRPYGEAWVSVADVQKMTSFSDANRYTGGASMSYQAAPNFLNRLTVGVDLTNDNKQRFFPYDGNYGSAYVFNGEKDDAYRYYSIYTADYLGQVNFKLPFGIGSDLSFGGQGFYETDQQNVAVGKSFPGPGVSTVAAASQTFGSELYTHSVNIGGLAQNRFSFKDRLFTTVGIRVDGNSAFGKSYGYQTYPKFDVAYNLGGLSWVPAVVSNFKLRGAWGKAGKAPGPFDQYQTFKPEAVYTNTPALTPYNPGNTQLAPEITTEVDGGFDAGLFNDRVGLEFSYYRQGTHDAIVNVQLPPSQGFTQAQKQNIGGIVNVGWEAALNWLTYATRDLEWHNDFRFDGNHNKVTDLHGLIIGSNTIYRVGYPVRGIWMQRPVSFNTTTQRWVRSDTAQYIGPPLPTFNLSYSPSVRWRKFQLFAIVTLERGAILQNTDRPYRFRQHTGDEFLSLLGPGGVTTPAADSAVRYWQLFDDPEKRDNTRIRTISLSYELPQSLTSKARLGTTSIMVSENNVKIWAHCHCQDPNQNTYAGDDFSTQLGFLPDPAPHLFRISVRSRF